MGLLARNFQEKVMVIDQLGAESFFLLHFKVDVTVKYAVEVKL